MAAKSGVSRAKRLITKLAKIFGCCCLIYLLILLVGLIPMNRDFVAAEDGIQVFLTSNAVHADIIVPVSNDTIDWRREFAEADFLGDTSGKSHVAFGWGDRGFYLHTPTWDDLKFSTAAHALLWPSDTCIHVDFTNPTDYGSEISSVTLNEQQYRELVKFIRGSFVIRDDSFQQINDYQYSFTDAFFEAKGTYHVLNTCNSWVGQALKAAGVKVPFLTPMPKSPMLYLPEQTKSD